MIWTTILMAIREMRRNKMRTFLTMLGIMIGVASVILMVALGRGASAKITDQISSMGTNLLILQPGTMRRGPTQNMAQPFKQEDVRALTREIESMALVAPAGSKSVLMVNGNQNYTSMVTGSTNAYFQIRAYELEMGTPFTDAQLQGGAAVCVLGPTVRKKLFGNQSPLGSSVRIGSVDCQVIGLTRSKGQSGVGNDPDDFALVPLATFQRRFAGSTDVSTVYMSAKDEKRINRLNDEVTMIMRERRRIPPGAEADFNVMSMQELVSTLGTVTSALVALLGSIAAISLLVGGIGIMNIMLVSVTERTREIGIRLSIGARAREVLFQFLIESMSLSAMGGLAGIILGLLAALVASKIAGIPFSFVPDMTAIAFLFSAGVGVLFGYLPARKASRLNPIEALRHE